MPRSGPCLAVVGLVALAALAGALAVVATPAAAQGDTVQARLTVSFPASSETAEMELSILDPGSLASVQLGFGSLGTHVGEAELVGSAWTWQGQDAVADLKADPTPSVRWTAQAQVRVESLEGEGFTSYVGPSFALLKVGDLMPSVRYSFPEGRDPSFDTRLVVDAPAAWTVKGPWVADAGAGPNTFRIDSVIPRGYLVAGQDLVEGRLGEGADAYRIVRIAGAAEDETTVDILRASRTFLQGIYGSAPINQFIVVGPDPLFRGGLGSPEGIYLHADADASVVAHELVHVYQGFPVSRRSGDATVWLAEGTAVAHGALLEATAGIKTRQEVLDFLNSRRDLAVERDAAALSDAVYGTPFEAAAYTKGSVVVIALNDALRETTDGQFTLADVLRTVNREAQEEGAGYEPLSNDRLVDVIGRVTRVDVADFFDRFVYGDDVPILGAVFPGQAAVRIVGTDPDPPVALQPVSVRVALTNLDIEPVHVDVPVLVNGTEAGRLVATLAPGGTAEAEASLTPLARGTYTVRVEDSSTTLHVLAAARLAGTVTVWPDPPVADRRLTLGIELTNDGEAPYRGVVTVDIDGRQVRTESLDVAGGTEHTFPIPLDPLVPGTHDVVARTTNGTVLASRTLTVEDSPEPPSVVPWPTAPLALAIVLATAALVGTARTHGRRGTGGTPGPKRPRRSRAMGRWRRSR